MLKQELEEKNKQIAQFQERQREQNVLMSNLQERLALVAPKRSAVDDVVTVATEAEEGSEERRASPKHARRQESVWTRPLFQGWLAKK
jgi:hypothetical protein